MKVPRHVIEARRARLAELLQANRYMPVGELCSLLGVSEATMRRDLTALVEEQKVTRTYGGALVEFSQRFPSFESRRREGLQAKRQIAARARELIAPGMVCFLDSGTTVHALAEALARHPIRPLVCVSNNIPVCDLLSSIPGVEVHLLGGQYLPQQSVLFGPAATRGADIWRFDIAFFAGQAFDAQGLWNSRPEIAELQRAILKRSAFNVLLADAAKAGKNTEHAVCGWNAINLLLTDASAESLVACGISAQLCDEATQAQKLAELSKKGEGSGLTLPSFLL